MCEKARADYSDSNTRTVADINYISGYYRMSTVSPAAAAAVSGPQIPHFLLSSITLPTPPMPIRSRVRVLTPGAVEGDLQYRSQTQSEPQAMTKEGCQ